MKDKQQTTQPRTITSNKVNQNVSYAQITKNKQTEHTAKSESETQMMQMIQNMMTMIDQVNYQMKQNMLIMEQVHSRLDKLEARATGAIPKRK